MSRFPRLVGEPVGGFEACAGCQTLFTKLSPDGLCPDCEGESRQAQEIAALPEQREQILRRCGVPGRYARTPFIEPNAWPVDRRGGDLAAWEGEPWAVTLTGEVGTGKSMLAVELLWRDLVRCRKDGTKGDHLFIRGADAVSIAFGNAAVRTFGQLVRARLLVLDDLGAGVTGDAWAALDRLVGPRWDEERPTVVTTNLRADSMVCLHDSATRIADRLSDGLWAQLSGDSRRGWS